MDEDLLVTLHTAVAEILLAKIRSGEAKSADLGVAVRFLKDNGIEAVPTNENPIQLLLNNLPFDEDEDLEEQLMGDSRH